MNLQVDLDAPMTRAHALQRLSSQGFCTLNAASLAALVGVNLRELDALRPSWDDLPPDAYLKDGGRYRYRRHGCYVQAPGSAALEATPHRAHWQPTTYNALHGGMQRWFEPLDPALAGASAFTRLIASLGLLFAQAESNQGEAPRWFIETHPFRIDTTDGVGRPTPEGAHRDGVDFVAVILINRHAVRGGETRVFDARGPQGVRFTLCEPFSALLLDDARVIHESTPIQPEADRGWRDTLVLTYRRGGFQEPASPPAP